MSRRLLASALVGCAACAGSAPLTREALVGTAWTEICPDAEIATAYLRLEPDSSLAWSYDHPDSLQTSDVHRWTLDEGRLVVAWNQGGAVSHYGPGRGGALVGVSTFCSEAVTLVRRR